MSVRLYLLYEEVMSVRLYLLYEEVMSVRLYTYIAFNALTHFSGNIIIVVVIYYGFTSGWLKS